LIRNSPPDLSVQVKHMAVIWFVSLGTIYGEK